MHQDLFEKNVINKLKPNLTYNNNDINNKNNIFDDKDTYSNNAINNNSSISNDNENDNKQLP